MSSSSSTPPTTPTMKIPQSSLSLGGSALRKLVTIAARNDILQQQQETTTLDLRGLLWMEHINLVVGSNELAKYFYLDVLGLTRDAGRSFHVNLGQQQFHLAEVKSSEQTPQRIAGSVGLVVPNLKTLRDRLDRAVESDKLKNTQFGVLDDSDDCVTVRGPWGNIFYLYSVEDDNKLSQSDLLETPRKMENMHAEGGVYGGHRMAVRGQPGIRYIEIACPMGTSPAVARFYRELLGCAVLETSLRHNDNDHDNTAVAVVCVGPGVHMAFVERETLTSRDRHAMEGVHVCFYVNDFGALYRRLTERNLIWTNPRFVYLDTCDTWEEAYASRTLRFKDIVDLSTNEKIIELEHETRPLRHGQYLKIPKYEPK
eukprot:CAMPEP_0172480504 /NCGR_PEP_ID=MMETSP1066-20121228/5689_1 /TAXON_ID=671091 /ORGANISM="Coscinodiscus wailesii, Strain CCMP2513" /LENGTH=369 /DNA_ID=CAMNT_0013241879 /DNA_START=125 /DNA_END=1234 /DNA_ORIENTATION=-